MSKGPSRSTIAPGHNGEGMRTAYAAMLTEIQMLPPGTMVTATLQRCCDGCSQIIRGLHNDKTLVQTCKKCHTTFDLCGTCQLAEYSTIECPANYGCNTSGIQIA